MTPYQLSITKEVDPIVIGGTALFLLEVRDRHGSLTDPEHAAAAEIFLIDPDSGELTRTLEGETKQDSLEDGTALKGRYVCEIDTSLIGSVGTYLIRFKVPYGESFVQAQETFVLASADVVSI